MPPRRPKVSADDEFEAAPYTTRKLAQNLGVDDLNLPRSMVQRLAKGVLPPNTTMQRDAILAISKSATVFVNYLASHANDRATLNNKKTVQPEDVFEALKELEFEDMVLRCQEEEKRYAAMLNTKRNDYRRRIKEEKAEADKGKDSNGDAPNGTLLNGSTSAGDEPPASKKPRLSNGAATDLDDSIMNDADDNDDTVDENEADGSQDEEDEEDQEDEEEPDHVDEEENEMIEERHNVQDDEASDSD